ncbi:hypothetical protein Mapa_013529 [Marchantia paleacea]|nr:hypothetical protein Mapa_013529 [Marchantia paleacea]
MTATRSVALIAAPYVRLIPADLKFFPAYARGNCLSNQQRCSLLDPVIGAGTKSKGYEFKGLHVPVCRHLER